MKPRQRTLSESQAERHGSEVGEPNELAERRRRSIIRRRGTLVRRSFMFTDLLGFTAAFLIAERFFGIERASWDNHLNVDTEILVFFVTLPVWLLIVSLYGLYRRDEERTDHSTADDVVPVFHVVTVGVWLFQGGSWLTRLAQPQFPKLLTFWAAAIVFVTFARVVARRVCRSLPSYVQNTLILGADDVGQLIARKLRQHPEYGLNLIGFVETDARSGPSWIERLPVLGATDDLDWIIRDRDVERVIVAGRADGPAAVETIHQLKRSGVQIDIVPRLFEVVGPGIDIHKIEGISLIGLPPTRLTRPALLAKRLIDIVVSGLALVIASPFFAFVAWRIRRDSPGPVFFAQTRLGQDMREITMLKFRTMTVDADEETHREYIRQIMDKRAHPAANGLYKLERATEITPFGRFLRRTSLDELPQLINVLRGEMSLVGPRPCLRYEVEHFERHHFERFSVPAGITGLWQVTARARSTFIEALEMDVAYARGWSLGLDLWVLARTPLQLFTKRGTTA